MKNKLLLLLKIVALALFLPATLADAGVAELSTSLNALKNHITGSSTLNGAAIAVHKATIDANKAYFGSSQTSVTAGFSLVEAYDNEFTPLWTSTNPVISERLAHEFDRTEVSNEDIHWVVYNVMQDIFDYTYTTNNISAWESFLNGKLLRISERFPGAVAPPADPGNTHTVTINARYLDTFGWDRHMDDLPARKPTGTYAAPGTIVTVTVPSTLVNTGYQVRVGCHSWDLDAAGRPWIKRLDRVSKVFAISSTTMKVSNPLGGGIYIEVPYRANRGNQNITIKGAVRSPSFSVNSVTGHNTTLSEWQNTERHHPGPWADFQTEKFMMQVPTDWIYNMDDPASVLADWDTAADMENKLLGFPINRGKETFYLQVDVENRSVAYAPGYPETNHTYNPDILKGGYAGDFMVRGPLEAPSYFFHEQAHGYFFDKFDDETESTTNLPLVSIWNQGFDVPLDTAFAASEGKEDNPNRTLDNTAVAWMTSLNFSPREVEMELTEKKYQMKGHAKFVAIASLFGWDKVEDYHYQLVADNISKDTSSLSDDDRIVRLSEAVGYDLRPLLHFWGIHPEYPSAVADAIAAKNLPTSTAIYDLLQYYKTLIPANNTAFQTYCLAWWERQPQTNPWFLGTEHDHARQWDSTNLSGANPILPNGEIYDASSHDRIVVYIDKIIGMYYSNLDHSPPTPNPMTWAMEPYSPASGIGDPLNILTPATLAGNNPATGQPWAVGDTYRIAFVSSGTRDAAASTIGHYNSFLQGAAQASTLNIGSATWNVIGSTDGVDARDNTSSNPSADGTGEAIFLVDGTTIVANNYADLWDGGLDKSINTDENGVANINTSVAVGSNVDGTTLDRHLGGSSTDDPAKISTGNSSRSDGAWAVVYNGDADSEFHFYALSDPITLVDGITMIATQATDTFSVEYYFDETSGNTGGSDSGWQDSNLYTDTGLVSGVEYTYTVRARDTSVNQNETTTSVSRSATYDGAEVYPVPEVVGLTEATAGSNIVAAGFVVGTKTYSYSATVAATNVISQNPTAETSVVAGTSVNLVVSLGAAPADTTAPNPNPMSWAVVPAAGSGPVTEVINYFQVTTDADSGISSANTYTHAIDFGSNAPVTVNGVVFASDVNQSAGGLSNAGTRTYGNGTNSGSTAPAVSGDVGGVFRDMVFGGPDLGYVELTGLTANQWYEVRLYDRAWDYQGTNRTFYASFDIGSDGSAEFTTPKINQNNPTLTPLGLSGNVSSVISYTYQADASGKMKITIDLADDQTGSYHFYGLTNQETTPSGVSETKINMTATTATDPSGVEYYFTCTAGAGHDSGWQDSTAYTDTALSAGTQYTYTVMARDKSTNQNATNPSIAASAITGGVVVGYPIPNVVGSTEATAVSSIVADGFVVGTISTAYSATVQSGDVISQSPAAGTPAPAGASVSIVVSLGVQTVTVPNVVGLSQAAAEANITAAVLNVGAITSVYSETITAGEVISQSLTAGANVVAGSSVSIVVSLGEEPVNVTVPDVVGMADTTAQSTITTANLSVGSTSTTFSNTVAAGNVISQNPVSGSSIPENSTIDIVVSLGAAPATAGPLKVFILAGQSNMQGKGLINGITPGHLEQMVLDDPAQFGHLKDGPNWTVRDDVSVWYVNDGTPINGGLTVGYGSYPTQIGPELQFGHVMGDYFDDHVLIIKLAWGGKALFNNFRPPSSGWDVNPPVADTDQGYYYKEVVDTINDFKANPANYCSSYDPAKGYEIVGLGWHQGYNDRFDSLYYNEYEQNMENFIKDVRADLEIPNLPFSIATASMDLTSGVPQPIIDAQLAMGNFTTYPEFSGNVAVDDTENYGIDASESPSGQGYHWNWNCKSYFWIGEGLAEQMLDILPAHLAVPVPDVVGMTQANAESAVVAAGFTVGTVSSSHSGTITVGSVVSQTPTASTTAVGDSLVDIVVSLGVDTTAPNPNPMTWASVPTGGIQDTFGILTSGTLSGNNPATGAPWAPGDTYRLAFVTGGTRNAASDNIADYNAFVQAAAAASDLGLGGVSWKAIGSTGSVDARDNTSTNPFSNGAGQAIFLVNGSTLVATGHSDLWDGGLASPINVDENGNTGIVVDVATGTSVDGTGRDRHLGGDDASTPLLEFGNSSSGGGQWMVKYNGEASVTYPLYALSAPITIVEGISMTATSATDASGVEYNFTETSGNPGSSDSGWQDSPVYADTGLSDGTIYTYTVKARDKSSNQNETVASGAASATIDGTPVGDPVPDVVSLAQASAQSAITSAGFSVGTVTTQYSNTVAAGDVISQNPSAGTTATAGSTVNLVVSLGIQVVTVPDLVGLTQATAESTVTGAGLSVGNVTNAYSSSVAAGEVVSQNPSAGASVAQDSPVDLVISLGVNPSDNDAPNPNPMTWASVPLASSGDPLGVLTAATLSGNNPATGAPWATGDTYRLVFVTNGSWNAASTDIADYNSFVQTTADASALGLAGVSWSVIGSTATVNAKDNTSTNPSVNGTGEAIFLVDGSTVVANNYADLWDGGIDAPINTDENGTLATGSTAVFAGTKFDGTTSFDNVDRHLGSVIDGRCQTGRWDGTGSNWVYSYHAAVTDVNRFYAISDPITIGTSITMTATAATDASGVEYYFTETSSAGSDSGWQDSSVYTDTGLQPGTQYTYTVTARDKSPNQNTTAPSGSASATTDGGGGDTAPPAPNPADFAAAPAALSDTEITMTSITGSDASGPVEYLFTETSGNPGSTSSSWQSSPSYTDSGLDEETQYTYTVTMRDSLGNTGSSSVGISATTDPAPDTAPPNPDPMTWASVPAPVSAGGELTGELGILDLTANGGINPATGAAWASGDTYRLAFVTSGTRDATDPDIGTYNAFIQNAADAAGLGGATWLCVGQAYNDSSRDINIGITASEGPVYLVDGVTKLWDSPFSGNLANTYSMTETGGSYIGNVASGSGRKFGDPTQTNIENGASGSLSNWWQNYNGSQSGQWHFYALSDPLIIGGSQDPETEITMTADTATDPSGVEYYFDETSGNPGGSDSGWQDSTVYTDTGLSAGTQYTYAIIARDKSVNQNATAQSVAASATTGGGDTDAPTPNPASFASAPSAVSSSAISMTATTGTDASGPVEYYFDETSGNAGGSDSGWQTSASYTDSGLNASTQYTYTVTMRDSLGNTGSASSGSSVTTDAAPDTDAPTPNPASFASAPSADSSSAISMTATTGTDASGPVEYYFDETSGNAGGSDSGWQTSASYTDSGLNASTQYTYTVTMRDSLGNTGSASAGASATTLSSGTGISDPLGILSSASLAGNNPATGQPWAAGDTYRLAFVTSTATQATSTDIATYNTFVQGLANTAGLGSVNWNVVGSTSTVDARDNTSTNPTTDGTGEAIFLMDGTNVIANSYSDLWDGINIVDNGAGTWYGVYFDENGNEKLPQYGRVFTGSSSNGTASTDQDRVLGGSAETEPRTQTGKNFASFAMGANSWMTDWSNPSTTQSPVYALSDPITIGGGGGNQPPVFNADPIVAPDASPPTGPFSFYALSIDDYASDPDGDPMTWVKVSGPAWLDVYGADPTLLLGVSAASDVGLNVFTFQVSDGNGGTDTATLHVTVLPDTDAPTPNSATFASAPSADSSSAISMTATTGTDASGPVEYLFTETSGNPGGTSSGWQASPSYTDTGLNAETQYTYTVTMRDSLGNTGSSSVGASATTDVAPDETAPNPNPMSWASAPATSSSDPVDFLTAATLSGNNPATGAPWQAGDTYRLAFVTSTTTQATSTDIATYNAFVQDAANAAGLGGASWKVVGSTSAVDARDNTGTNPDTDGTGVAVYLVDGTTVLAANNSDLWDGANVALILDENGVLRDPEPNRIFTGSTPGGTASSSSDGPLGNVGDIQTGRSDSSGGNWMTDWKMAHTSSHSVYALSDPIVITASYQITMTATTASDPAGVEYYFTETSGNTGGDDSGWQDSPIYTDTGLELGTQYTYTVTARDKSTNQNATAASVETSATTTAVTVPDVVELAQPDISPKLVRTTVSSVSSTSWTTVDLGQLYNSAVIIATPIYLDTNTPPVVTRITNVNGSSFDLKIDRADGLSDAVTIDVSIVAVDEGIYTQAIDGVTMEAVKFTSTLTAENGNWSAEARSYQNSYINPVVVGQVMSANDADWSVFWSMGSSQSSPADASNLNVGKHVGEDTDTTRTDETIGYIVIESGSGTISGVAYEAGLGADSVQGLDDSASPYTYSLGGGLSSVSSVAVSIAGMDDSDGGWAVLSGSPVLSTTSIGLHACEDQIEDAEQNHSTEQVGYIVFE